MRGSETGGETNRSLVAAEGAVGEKGVIVPMGGPPSEYRRPSLYSFDRSRGEGPRLLRRVRQRKNATIANASPPTTPPTTPPTIGPVDERLRPLEDSELLFPPPAFVLEFEPPSKPPGATMVTLGTLWDIRITLDFSKYETAIATSRAPTSTQAAQT